MATITKIYGRPIAVEVEFALEKQETKLGECIRVVGNHPQLGNWNAENGLLLTTDEASYPAWIGRVSLRLPATGGTVDFKYVMDCRGCGKGLNPEMLDGHHEIEVPPKNGPSKLVVRTPCVGSTDTKVYDETSLVYDKYSLKKPEPPQAQPTEPLPQLPQAGGYCPLQARRQEKELEDLQSSQPQPRPEPPQAQPTQLTQPQPQNTCEDKCLKNVFSASTLEQSVQGFQFRIECDNSLPNEELYLVGSEVALGSWDPHKAIKCSTNAKKFPTWTSSVVVLPSDSRAFEFKLLKKGESKEGGYVKWEDGKNNHRVVVPESLDDQELITVQCSWGLTTSPCSFAEDRGESKDSQDTTIGSEQAPSEFSVEEPEPAGPPPFTFISNIKVNCAASPDISSISSKPSKPSTGYPSTTPATPPKPTTPTVVCDDEGSHPSFSITFESDAHMPFRQVFLWEGSNAAIHLKQDEINERSPNKFEAVIPAGTLKKGKYSVQVEGCQVFPFEKARPENWIKDFTEVLIKRKPRGGTSSVPVKIYFGIHKHMHQPYYNTTDQGYWDPDIDHVFHMRRGPYNYFVPNAVRQHAQLPHGGMSTTWSGSLIEQCDRCEREALGRGDLIGWKNQLREIAHWKTECGNPRLDFAAFGYFHPLMPLIPERDIIKQIQWHADIIQNTFGVPASKVMFPPETAFHVRMIPALCKAGIEAVMYDSIHRYRTAKGYTWGGPGEGMLPPNQSEQENPELDDWMQLDGCWSASKISPTTLRPEYVKYEDPNGEVHKIIAVPCERYIGNEDARGGYGGWYLRALGGIHEEMVDCGTFDPKHPPFFILHSDGDNYGGGSEGYYGSNTAGLVEWLQNDDRFELTTVMDYLDRFPPDPDKAVHIEPGAWSGANNGDPQFMKWFTDYMKEYSPDLNSWAVLTYFQNVVHSIEDSWPNSDQVCFLQRLLLLAETSCYWYYTGEDKWDFQVTNACNQGLGLVADGLGNLANSDSTPPTIFPPWVTPENPGCEAWPFEHGHLTPADSVGTVHTFIGDVSGVKRATLVLRAGGVERKLAMTDQGAYPSKTKATSTSQYFTLELPVGLGDTRYYIEAEDGRGNIARSALERVYLAAPPTGKLPAKDAPDSTGDLMGLLDLLDQT